MEIKIITPISEAELQAARELGYQYAATITRNPSFEQYFKSQNFLTEIDKMPKG